MSRLARETSTTGIYHVILRGVNKQQIFECSEDYEHFVRILQRQCGLPVEVGFGDRYRNPVGNVGSGPCPQNPRHCYIYAWCLMGNHVHLLLKSVDEEIGAVMKRIASSYVYYYNHKYERIGHLFQERFKSQPVEDMDYFISLLRYIHQNPLKPMLCRDLADYRWCSWREYLGKDPLPFCSTEVVLKRIDIEELTKLVYDILPEEEEQRFIDIDVKPRQLQFTDDEVWTIINNLCSASNLSEFQALPRPIQKHVLYCAHEEGVGPTTLSRLTGIGYSVVQRATSALNERLKRLKGCVAEMDAEDEEYLSYFDADEFAEAPEY